MQLIVGLGNPGRKYAATRHNIGFMTISRLAEETGVALKRHGYQGIYGVGRVAGVEATLLLPQTYMNHSGASVGAATQSLGIAPGDLIVVHDEIDLDFGVLRIKRGGGHAGHNGLRSICGVLGTADFVRIRCGVGRPPVGGDVSGYVLNGFNATERAALDDFLVRAGEAVSAVLQQGTEAAMNEFNRRSPIS